ncbi:MAG: hypothetical protein CML06_17440 [Pseudomonadales bacterium]|nr:hypothetical protein [Pseudomonadales bacterium]
MKADIHNQIIISTATLESVKSEDQLAGMLAHELSHILMSHNHDKSVYANLVPGFLEATGLASVLYKSHKSKEEESLSKQRVYEMVVSTNTASWVWSDLVSPAWDRKHEQQADKMGLDLMIKAGYNPSAYMYALQGLADITARKTERLQYLKKVAVSETAKRIPSARTGTDLDKVVAALELSVKQKVLESFFDNMAIFSIQHDPGSKREEYISEYLTTAYKDKAFFIPIKTEAYESLKASPEVSQLFASDQTASQARENMLQEKLADANRLSASALNYRNRNEVFVRVVRNEVRLAQQRPDKARQNLELALQQPLATRSVFSNLAQVYMLRNDPVAAEKVLLQAGQRLGQQPADYPVLVAVAMAQQDVTKAEQYVEDCRDEQKLMKTVKSIFKKSRGLNVQDTIYEQCVAVLGYDPREKKKQEREKEDGKENKVDEMKDKLKSLFG